LPKVLFITHSEAADPGNVRECINSLGYETICLCPMLGDKLPLISGGNPQGFDATVVFGGPQLISEDANVNYIYDEIEWIRSLVKSDSKLLGICLGAQMIAASYGCLVGPHPEKVREIGFHNVKSLPEGQDYFNDNLLFYQWHREGFELPKEAILLATGDTYPNQAFKVGENVFGIQFHPEITLETMERWITSEKGAPQLILPGAQSAREQRKLAKKCIRDMKLWLMPFLQKWLF